MEPDGDYCIEARIANISFLIDLSHSQKFIPVVQAKALETHGTDGWTTLPTAG